MQTTSNETFAFIVGAGHESYESALAAALERQDEGRKASWQTIEAAIDAAHDEGQSGDAFRIFLFVAVGIGPVVFAGEVIGQWALVA